MKSVIAAVLAIFMFGCSDNKENVSQKEGVVSKTQQEVKKTQSETVVQKQEQIKEVSQEASVEQAKPVEQKVQTSKTATEVKEEVKKVVEVAQPKVEVVAKEQQKVVATVDGAKLFSKCVACHGANGEKKALNKSQVIKGWSEEKVLTALHGYKAGTYGSSMKGVMKAQIANFSEEELKALAKHISKL